QQVAKPTVSYRLRSQCCPVQSYVQRCCSVPVTTYQQSFYWEPVTTCVTPGAPSAGPGVGEQRLPSSPSPSPSATPGVGESRNGGTGSGTGSGSTDGPYGRSVNPLLRPEGIPSRQMPPRTSPPPNVRLERIVSLPGPNLEGQVLRGDQQPHPGAR